MSPDTMYWLNAAQTLAYVVAGFVVASIVRGFKVGKWVQSIDHSAEIGLLRKDMDARFDAAGKRMSDLADDIQVYDTLYLRKEVADMFMRESRDARSELRADIEQLRLTLNRRRN